MLLNNHETYPAPKQFIAGKWPAGGDGAAVEVRNPAIGQALADIPSANRQDLDDTLAASEESQAGGIGIHIFAVSQIEAPFGGVKDSGYGQEGGPEGLQAYMHSKYVNHA